MLLRSIFVIKFMLLSPACATASSRSWSLCTIAIFFYFFFILGGGVGFVALIRFSMIDFEPSFVR